LQPSTLTNTIYFLFIALFKLTPSLVQKLAEHFVVSAFGFGCCFDSDFQRHILVLAEFKFLFQGFSSLFGGSGWFDMFTWFRSGRCFLQLCDLDFASVVLSSWVRCMILRTAFFDSSATISVCIFSYWNLSSVISAFSVSVNALGALSTGTGDAAIRSNMGSSPELLDSRSDFNSVACCRIDSSCSLQTSFKFSNSASFLVSLEF
jgi:hypothetical protein